MRVVCGIAKSWDLNTAAVTFPSEIKLAVWSTCGSFIAAIWSETLMVDILDSVTLQRLQTLEVPQDTPIGHKVLSFSPDSRVLTLSTIVDNSSDPEFFVIIWDLQTGGIINTIKGQGPEQQLAQKNPTSITYSVDGEMVAVFYLSFFHQATIFVCNVTSGVHVHTHSFPIPPSFYTRDINKIWTHGESLRFATATHETITIWEAGFASGTAKEVYTISIKSDMFNDQPDLNAQRTAGFLFLPTLSRLAATDYWGTLMVWDAQDSKLLLHCGGMDKHPRISFSSDGNFLACPTTGSEVYLWKGSLTGYTLQGILTSSIHSIPLLSPNGESIVVFGGRLIRLWQTKSFTTSPSSAPTQSQQITRGFVLDFSPDGTLVVFARLGDTTVTVLNLKSSVLQLTIHASVGVYGLKMTADTIVIISDKKTITWNLPMGGYAPDTIMDIEDSVWTVNLNQTYWAQSCTTIAASISPNLCHIAVITRDDGQSSHLDVYSASTGEHHGNLVGYKKIWDTPQFTPDGSKIWCPISGGEPELLTTPSGGFKDDSIELMSETPRVDPQNPPEGYPWRSSCGYQTTEDGWVLNPDGKHLLMLPPPWWSGLAWQMWNGRYLALLHSELPEPVILEFES